MTLQHQFQNAPRRGEVSILEAALPVMRRVAGGVKQYVALAEWQFERLRQAQHHRPARLRSPRFDKAHMARRDPGFERQRKLAHSVHAARLFERPAEGCV